MSELMSRPLAAGILDGANEVSLCNSGLTLLEIQIEREKIENGRDVGRKARRSKVTGRNYSVYQLLIAECKRVLALAEDSASIA